MTNLKTIEISHQILFSNYKCKLKIISVKIINKTHLINKNQIDDINLKKNYINNFRKKEILISIINKNNFYSRKNKANQMEKL